MVLAGALGLGLAMAGCSKKKDASSTASAAAESPSPAPAPAAPAMASGQTRAESEASFQTQDLQLSVEAYEKIYKRKPTSLEQMVKEGFLASLPAAPPGKRFSLDAATGRVSVVPR